MTLEGDDRARAYAAWARSGTDASFSPVLAALIELLPPAPARVLDVGCGEGRVGAELVRRGYAVVGVDVASAMVELARERHAAVVGDATALPFEPGTFDAVISVHTLMEVDDLDSAVREAARVLVRGGAFVALVEHPFASGRKVDRYSDETRYGWERTHEGVDLRLGGTHRPLGRYVSALEHAGLALDALRELSVGRFDPLSLAIRASLPFG
jgi:SAM-dependent methyltransferase